MDLSILTGKVYEDERSFAASVNKANQSQCEPISAGSGPVEGGAICSIRGGGGFAARRGPGKRRKAERFGPAFSIVCRFSPTCRQMPAVAISFAL